MSRVIRRQRADVRPRPQRSPEVLTSSGEPRLRGAAVRRCRPPQARLRVGRALARAMAGPFDGSASRKSLLVPMLFQFSRPEVRLQCDFGSIEEDGGRPGVWRLVGYVAGALLRHELLFFK